MAGEHPDPAGMLTFVRGGSQRCHSSAKALRQYYFTEPARPFNFAGSAILAFLIGGGLTVFRVLKTKMDEREEALYKAKMEAAQGGAEGGAEGGDEEGPRDRNARTDYSKFKEEMDAAAKEAEDKAEGK